MSILPSFLEETARQEPTQTRLQIPREYGVDFKTGELTGKIVEGKEALKVWIWNCLKTPRFRHGIYSWNYGVGFEEYVGQTVSEEFLEADAESEIEEALLVNPYITGIRDFLASMEEDKLEVSFTAMTTLGDIEEEVETFV